MAKRIHDANGMTARLVRAVMVPTAILAALMGGLVGCAPDDFPHGVVGPGGAGPGAPSNESGLVSFRYSVVNAFGDGSYTVDVEMTDVDEVRVTYDIFGYEDLGDISCKADASLLAELEAVYRDQHIAAWNGFDRVDQGVLDGGGFGLQMTFADGATLSTHGSNTYPDGFREFSEAIDPILSPYRAKAFGLARQRAIKRGTKGDLNSIMVTFKQHGSSGSDEYSFVIAPEGELEKNFDVTIKSSGEFFPEGSVRYYATLPDEALWFDRIQKLIERYDVMQWHHWDEAAEDYGNSEWFQIDLSYSEEGRIDAMGTLHPENYDEFRTEFLKLMAKMTKNAELVYGLKQHQ